MKSDICAFLNVYKPQGMTAHDVVARVRKIAGLKQVGHAGTLDPMARGVLPIALGRACRLLRFLQDDKVYKASILFGQSTDTDDIEGKVIATSEHTPTENEIAECLEKFRGEIEQKPPYYSAIHVGGERLYKMARKGEEMPEIPTRRVTVHSIETLGFSANVLELRIHCSTGTYIRSIARDLGELLGTCACLCALERERAGPFDLSQSHTLEQLAEAAALKDLTSLQTLPENKLDLPSLDLSPDQFKRLTFGQRVDICRGDTLGSAPIARQLGDGTLPHLTMRRPLADPSLQAGSGNAIDQANKSGSAGYQPASNIPNTSQTPAADSPPEYVMAMYNNKLAAICLLQPKELHEQLLSDPTSFIVELKPEVVLLDASAK